MPETKQSITPPIPTTSITESVPASQPPSPLPSTPTPELSEPVQSHPTETPQRVYYAYGPFIFPLEINPLTGLQAPNPALLDRRPIVVKVTNFPRSVRPQWGLTLADHVYEYYIADGMSRFIGVFYSQDANQAGPIRSARIFDAHVMRMYNGVFVFGYADDPVLEFFMQPDIKNRLIVERPDNCPPLCRIGPENAYNNLYINTSQVADYLKSRRTGNPRPDLSGLRFELDIPKSGNSGQAVSVQYSIVSYHRWDFNPASGRYLRYQDVDDDRGEKTYGPLTDSLTGAQISASNLFILFVKHEYFLQSSSTEIIDQPLIGSGKGFALRDGQIYPIEWTHASPDQLLTFSLPNGKFYPLKPGNSWFEVIGETSTMVQSPQGEWGFSYSFP